VHCSGPASCASACGHALKGAASAIAVRAVDELGKPTISSTLTIIAALLPTLIGVILGHRAIGAKSTATSLLFGLISSTLLTPLIIPAL